MQRSHVVRYTSRKAILLFLHETSLPYEMNCSSKLNITVSID